MALEVGTLIKLMESINTTLKTDPKLAVTGLGILLLGKKFEIETEDKNTDPTDIILKNSSMFDATDL